jgi:hypothetical protein
MSAEKALRDNERRLRLTVESAQDFANLMLDNSGRIAAWNSGARIRLVRRNPRRDLVLIRHVRDIESYRENESRCVFGPGLRGVPVPTPLLPIPGHHVTTAPLENGVETNAGGGAKKSSNILSRQRRKQRVARQLRDVYWNASEGFYVWPRIVRCMRSSGYESADRK